VGLPNTMAMVGSALHDVLPVSASFGLFAVGFEICTESEVSVKVIVTVIH
jgi:hypothetical protein